MFFLNIVTTELNTGWIVSAGEHKIFLIGQPYTISYVTSIRYIGGIRISFSGVGGNQYYSVTNLSRDQRTNPEKKGTQKDV